MILEQILAGLMFLISSPISVLVIPVVFGWIFGAVAIAKILGWGDLLFAEVNGTYVLKLPGGALLTAPPFVELFLLGIYLAVHTIVVFVAGTPMWVVAAFLITIVLVRVILWVLTHVLIVIGGKYARDNNLDFSIECMDNRCSHGTRSGNFLHNWACGGQTLLTALGVSPLVFIPVFFGLPAGPIGWVVFGLTMFPYFFVFSKLIAPLIPNDTVQKVLKGPPDAFMLTEWPGLVVGSLTASLAARKPLPPGYTPTSLH